MGSHAEDAESEVHAVTEISTRVRGRFPNAPVEQIEQAVSTAFHEFDAQPIRDFIPILVERAVIDRLRSPRSGSGSG